MCPYTRRSQPQPDLRPRHTRYTETLDNERCAREADIHDSVVVRSRVGVHCRKQEIRSERFWVGKGVEREQSDKVDILTEESVNTLHAFRGPYREHYRMVRG